MTMTIWPRQRTIAGIRFLVLDRARVRAGMRAVPRSGRTRIRNTALVQRNNRLVFGPGRSRGLIRLEVTYDK
uniref:Uncharacterized protein n=1 Tax=Siphoviridae sp. ctxfQ4 TaxID=2826521 RepID=A0A8S5N5F3_9CAUD|nr:MAG TPA: hypothetical protein [Siphoviridae sp. ctxfQ4]